ncbi:hypothetical protein DSECCO2_217820 [anaerobic digester metagenome]
MKKTKVVLACFVTACICLFYYFSTNYQRIQGFDTLPESGVKAYIYSAGFSFEKEGYTQIEQADYESFLKIISSIKYMNPKIDPYSDEYLVYGGSNYVIEVIYEDKCKTFEISSHDLRPNLRAMTFSDGKNEIKIAAYVKDDVYKEYEKLAKKYLKVSIDSENE